MAQRIGKQPVKRRAEPRTVGQHAGRSVAIDMDAAGRIALAQPGRLRDGQHLHRRAAEAWRGQRIPAGLQQRFDQFGLPIQRVADTPDRGFHTALALDPVAGQ